MGIAAAAAVLELVGSRVTGSLALLGDAGHVGMDAVAIGLSLVALHVSERPHTPRMSFGYHRTEVLAALTNAILLVGIAAFLLAQAYGRSLAPPPVQGGPMLLVGSIGLGANVVMLLLLRTEARRNINVRGAFLHAYGDALGSLGVVGGAALISVTGAFVLDVMIAVLIVGLIVASAARLLRDAVGIFLEASPAGVRPEEVADVIRSVDGVEGVHDLHVWTVSSGLLALTGHISVAHDATVSRAAGIVEAARERVRARFGIDHVTIQVDSFPEDLIAVSEIGRPPKV
jgi:cobalt-zinc-cadmium efflux system protein